MNIKKYKSLLFFILCLILSFWTLKSLFVKGFFPVHDDTQPSRIFEMTKAIQEGQFPVRMIAGLGYNFGYSLFNFYAPLPYYVGAIFNLIGFDPISSAKIMYGLGILCSSITMYFLMHKLKGPVAATATGVLYAYAPYHAVNIYVRGSVGEYYAYALLPLIILGIYMIFENDNKQIIKGMLVLSLSLGAVLLSHNIIGFLTILILLLFIIILFFITYSNKIQFSKFKNILISMILGFGISSFFVIPAIFEKQYTNVDSLITGGSIISDHFLYPEQLWSSLWGYGGSAPGKNDGMSFNLGKIYIGLGLLSILITCYYYFFRKIRIKYYILNISMIIVCIFSLILMFNISNIFWNSIPLLLYVQFPWRMLNFAILSVVILSGSLFFEKLGKYNLIILIFIVFSTIYTYGKYFVPKEFIPVNNENYISDVKIGFNISKISDEYLPYNFVKPKQINEIARTAISETENITIVAMRENILMKEYKLKINKYQEIITNVAYFPGWTIYLDGKYQTIMSKQGRVTINVPEGVHDLLIIFRNTPLRTLSNSISIFCLFLLLYLSLIKSEKLLWPIKKIR